MEQQIADENKTGFMDDEQAAQQEAYYWHVIAEFYGMLKYFGVSKVMADLETFKKTVEKPEEKSRIFIAHP